MTPSSLESAFLRLNELLLNFFFFFFFLSGSLGGVGSGLGKISGCSALYRLLASRCLWLTIFAAGSDALACGVLGASLEEAAKGKFGHDMLLLLFFVELIQHI